MLNKELIEKIKSHFDESGYLWIDKNIPLESHGNILEWTGQALMCLGLNPEINKKHIETIETAELLITGLCENEIASGLIPRTVYRGSSNPEPDKKGRWEKFSLRKAWYRTDVSDSQITFLLIGLYFWIDVSEKAKSLCSRIITRIISSGWEVTRLDVGPAGNGSFHSIMFDNTCLRMMFIDKICKVLEIDSQINFFMKINMRLSYLFFKIIPWSQSENSKNTALMMYGLGKCKQKVLGFFCEYMNKTTSPLKNNIENDINYELCAVILYSLG